MRENTRASLWQRRRSEFNHDFMKNQFLPALARWLNLLDDQLHDPHLEKTFLTSVLPAWEGARRQAICLIQELEVEMSPARYFDETPLSRCNVISKVWLADLVHELWLAKWAVRQRGEEAHQAIVAAEETYQGILRANWGGSGVRASKEPRAQRSIFELFRVRCIRVAESVELLGRLGPIAPSGKGASNHGSKTGT